MEFVLYEDRPRYDLWLKALFALAPLLLIVLSISIYYGVLPAESEEEARNASIVLFATAVFVLLLFWATFPRRYQIFTDRVKIVLGGPLSVNIKFDTIKEAREARGEKALGFWGLRFTTSTKDIVEIVRSKGMCVVISPGNRESFLKELNKAIADWKSSRG